MGIAKAEIIPVTDYQTDHYNLTDQISVWQTGKAEHVWRLDPPSGALLQNPGGHTALILDDCGFERIQHFSSQFYGEPD